jgi:hypothetical protein
MVLSLVVTPTDPNWLPSTEAQSAAALVAIIGGFLVSRLVALSMERQGLERRLDEHRAEADRLTRRIAESDAEISEYAEKRFRRKLLPLVVAGQGALPDAELMPDTPRGASDEEAASWAQEIRAEVSGLFSSIEGAMSGAEISVPSSEELMARGVDLSGHDPDLIESIEMTIAARRRPKSLLSGLDRSFIGVGALPVMPDFDSNISAMNLRETMAGQLRNRRDDIELLQEHLDRLASPTGVGWAVLALAAFSILGIIFPLVVMAIHPVPEGVALRTFMVVAFLVGLAGVLAFIWWQWSLLKKPEAHKDSWWRRVGKSLGVEALLEPD